LSILQGFTEGLLQDGQVRPEAAARQELGQLARFGAAESDGSSRAQTTVEQ
jgi:hypothetical protein